MAGWPAPEGLWPIGTPPTRFAPLFDSRVCRTRHRGASTLELPTSHRFPLSWLLEAASPPLQYRAYAEVVRESDRDPERLAALRQAVVEYKVAQAIARKQRPTGLWGGNLLGPVASKAHGWSEPGTVYQYRRLIELGWPPTERPFRLADRLLFQLLSRIEPDDPDRGVAQRAPGLLIEMLASLPPVQRERAGFIERLGHYFSTPAPRRAFFILAGKKLFKPIFELLGDPLRSDAQGHISDVPFALYWLELLTRLGLVRNIPSAGRVLARLFNEGDEQGIWRPKRLRALPKAISPVSAHYFPLEGPGKSPAQRQTDVTFRLALIARLMGLPVEIA